MNGNIMGMMNGVGEININIFKILSERPKLPQNRVFGSQVQDEFITAM